MNQNKLIYLAIGSLMILMLLSFFFEPKYKDVITDGVIAISNVLAFATGTKSGLSAPDKPADKTDNNTNPVVPPS